MIVATKLHIPHPRAALVSRPRLVRRLSEGLQHVLTLVTAPAGYGKTTLLGEWALTLEAPVAWVSLDRGDNDHLRFWTHTLAALKEAYPSLHEQAVLRFAAKDRTGDSLILALLNGLHRMSQPIVIIWDDIHVIENPAIHQGISYLLHRLPPHVHLYMASRTKPELPLARLRVEAGLNHIDVDELRFDDAETSAFFRTCGGMTLSDDDLNPIREQTEGWIAAMRLAVLSMDGGTDPAAIVRKLSGVSGDLSDYFFEEVLTRQPESLQQFLLRTAMLDRMTGGLCEAVTGMADSAACLQRLEQHNLFLIPLDDRREWYRYHPLFQQFLLAQLQIREPQTWRGLHHKAGRWLENNGYLPEAVDHYLSACRHEEALRLIESLAPDMMTDEWSTLGNWLRLIPEPLLIAKPHLLLTQLAALYLSGQTDAATDGYWQAIRRLEDGGPTNQGEQHRLLKAGLAFLAAIRTFLDGDFLDAVHFSKTYVEAHPEGDLFVGFGSDRDGYHPMWNVYVSDSSLRMAEEVLPSLLSIWSTTKNIYMIAHLNIDYGKWLYERNRLDEAESCMQRAWELGSAHDHTSLVTLASLWLARISVARGDAKTAQDMVNRIIRRTARQASPQLSGKVAWFSAMQGRLLGQDRPVRAWLRRSDLRPGDEISLSMIKEYNLLACCLAEQGKVQEAVVLLDRLLHMADEAGKQSDKIRLLVHKSIVLSGRDNLSQSMDVLEEALALAWPEGYIRTFVDEGSPLRTLLEQYLQWRRTQHYRAVRKVPLAYVKRLLRLLVSSVMETGESLLQESDLFTLTARERVVLQLMKEGLSNKEISQQLQVSLATVKTHIHHIYGKLQVNNRLQALERARTFKLS